MGTANGGAVTEGDRLFYDNGNFTVISSGGGGLTEITGTAPVVVSAVADGEQDVSMPAATSAQDGYMPKEAFSKLDGIDPGAEVNVNPTQTYTPSASQGVLTLTPGGDTTVVPIATETEAGLMSAADKQIIEDLVSNPDGVVRVGCW